MNKHEAFNVYLDGIIAVIIMCDNAIDRINNMSEDMSIDSSIHNMLNEISELSTDILLKGCGVPEDTGDLYGIDNNGNHKDPKGFCRDYYYELLNTMIDARMKSEDIWVKLFSDASDVREKRRKMGVIDE